MVSTEKLARGMTNDLILPVQYFVLAAILDVFCTRAVRPIFTWKLTDEESDAATCKCFSYGQLRVTHTCMRR